MYQGCQVGCHTKKYSYHGCQWQPGSKLTVLSLPQSCHFRLQLEIGVNKGVWPYILTSLKRIHRGDSSKS